MVNTIVKNTQSVLKKYSFLGCFSILVLLFFPIYQFQAHPDSFENYREMLFGNVLAGILLILGGRLTLILGSIIALQRCLEIMAVQAWNGYFSGITARIFGDFMENPIDETFSMVYSMWDKAFFALIFLLLYMAVYIYCAKIVLQHPVINKKSYSLMKRAFILLPITLVLYAGWQNRIQTDIFFFENDLNQDTKLFTQKNTYPSLVTTVPDDKKIDMYFVLGESVTKNHMSLYGYNRKTTPYLDSLEPNLLSVYKNPISPAGKTAPSLMTMLSRSSTFNKEMFYLSPNLVEELNTAGYNTVWTTYRKMNKANYVYPALINETNAAIDANSIYDDRQILTKTQPHLSQKPSVYFMHMYGSHINYIDRTPKELKHFTLQKSDSNKQRIIDAYDDSIRVLDIFLKDLHSMAQQHSQKTKRKFVIVYVSDHGQNIFGDGSDWFAHPRTGIKQQPNGWEVPLLLFNEKNLPCKNAFPDTESPALSTGDVFWWVLKGLCAIK